MFNNRFRKKIKTVVNFCASSNVSHVILINLQRPLYLFAFEKIRVGELSKF